MKKILKPSPILNNSKYSIFKLFSAKLNKAEEELMRNFANLRGDSAESAKVDNRENGLFGRLKDALGR